MFERLSSCQCCGSSLFVGLEIPKANDGHRQRIGAEQASRWVMCAGCSFAFQNPRPTLAHIESFYGTSGYREATPTPITQGYVDFAPHQLNRFHNWLLLNNYDLRTIRNGTTLDFGCGIGGATKFLAESNNKNYGVEIDRLLAEFGNKTFPIEIKHTLAELPANLSYDIIFSHHAIEHVFDPSEFFRYSQTTLKDNGLLCVVVPSWRYSNNLSIYDGFDTSDMSMWDHIALSRWLNKFGFYMTSYLYQNYGPYERGDWELCVTAVKSERTNELSFSVEEAVKELCINTPARCKKPIRPSMGGEHYGARL